METQNLISSERFGLLHWVMLIRVESWEVMNNGEIPKERMRTNFNKRPPAPPKAPQWDKMHSTRLNNGELVEDHDDWDCLDDLVGNGFVEIEIWKNKRLLSLTEKGYQAYIKLRKFKKDGNDLNLFKA